MLVNDARPRVERCASRVSHLAVQGKDDAQQALRHQLANDLDAVLLRQAVGGAGGLHGGQGLLQPPDHVQVRHGGTRARGLVSGGPYHTTTLHLTRAPGSPATALPPSLLQPSAAASALSRALQQAAAIARPARPRRLPGRPRLG